MCILPARALVFKSRGGCGSVRHNIFSTQRFPPLPPSPCISGRQNIGMWVVVSLSWEQKLNFKCQQFRPRSVDVMGQWSMKEILSVSSQDKGTGECQQYFIVAREKHEWNTFLRLEPLDNLQCHPHSSDYQYKERTVGDRESDPAPRE